MSIIYHSSGRVLLAASDDSTIHMWDITGTHLGQLAGHDNRQSQTHQTHQTPDIKTVH